MTWQNVMGWCFTVIVAIASFGCAGFSLFYGGAVLYGMGRQLWRTLRGKGERTR